jgi:hypothetical protein
MGNLQMCFPRLKGNEAHCQNVLTVYELSACGTAVERKRDSLMCCDMPGTCATVDNGDSVPTIRCQPCENSRSHISKQPVLDQLIISEVVCTVIRSIRTHMCVVEALIGATLGRHGVEVYATMQSGAVRPRVTKRTESVIFIRSMMTSGLPSTILFGLEVRHWLLLSGGPRALTIALISPILCCVDMRVIFV